MESRQELLDKLKIKLGNLRISGQSNDYGPKVDQFVDWCCSVATLFTKTTNEEIDYKCYHIRVVYSGVIPFRGDYIPEINSLLKQLIKIDDEVVSTRRIEDRC